MNTLSLNYQRTITPPSTSGVNDWAIATNELGSRNGYSLLPVGPIAANDRQVFPAQSRILHEQYHNEQGNRPIPGARFLETYFHNHSERTIVPFSRMGAGATPAPSLLNGQVFVAGSAEPFFFDSFYFTYTDAEADTLGLPHGTFYPSDEQPRPIFALLPASSTTDKYTGDHGSYQGHQAAYGLQYNHLYFLPFSLEDIEMIADQINTDLFREYLTTNQADPDRQPPIKIRGAQDIANTYSIYDTEDKPEQQVLWGILHDEVWGVGNQLQNLANTCPQLPGHVRTIDPENTDEGSCDSYNNSPSTNRFTPQYAPNQCLYQATGAWYSDEAYLCHIDLDRANSSASTVPLDDIMRDIANGDQALPPQLRPQPYQPVFPPTDIPTGSVTYYSTDASSDLNTQPQQLTLDEPASSSGASELCVDVDRDTHSPSTGGYTCGAPNHHTPRGSTPYRLDKSHQPNAGKS